MPKHPHIAQVRSKKVLKRVVGHLAPKRPFSPLDGGEQTMRPMGQSAQYPV
jgi:hypothetical protein